MDIGKVFELVIGIAQKAAMADARTEIFTAQDRTWIRAPNGNPVEVKEQRVPTEAIQMSTLDGFAELASEAIKNNAEGLAAFMCVLVDACSAELLFEADMLDGQYDVAIMATPAVQFPHGQLGRSLSVDEALVMLQTWFRPTEARAALLRALGNVQAEAATTLVDDGVSQSVIVKAGTGVGRMAIGNPVMLNAIRTFADVDIGEAPFVVRVDGGGEGKLPTVRLIGADGEQWRITAAKLITERLRKAIKAEIPIVA